MKFIENLVTTISHWTICKATSFSIELSSKKELTKGFIERVNTSIKVDDDGQAFVEEQKDLLAIIKGKS